MPHIAYAITPVHTIRLHGQITPLTCLYPV